MPVDITDSTFTRLRDATDGDHRDWHVIEVRADDVANVLNVLSCALRLLSIDQADGRFMDRLVDLDVSVWEATQDA